MRKLLIPIDGASSAARTRSAVAEAIAIHRREPVQIHLLSVQPAVSAHVAQFFAASELRSIHRQAAGEDLAPAQAQLDAARVPYAASCVVGRQAETIVGHARALGCDRILMGEENAPGTPEGLFGSLAERIRKMVGGASDCQVLGS
jgi:nucleotide-binding universal stress UspA family protein